MPIFGTSWKAAGLDTSPPRPAVTDQKRLAEMSAGRNMALLNGWLEKRLLFYDAAPDRYRTRAGTVFERPLIDGLQGGLSDEFIAQIALALAAGA